MSIPMYAPANSSRCRRASSVAIDPIGEIAFADFASGCRKKRGTERSLHEHTDVCSCKQQPMPRSVIG